MAGLVIFLIIAVIVLFIISAIFGNKNNSTKNYRSTGTALKKKVEYQLTENTTYDYNEIDDIEKTQIIGIYLISNLSNEYEPFIYVGKSNNVARRFKQHKKSIENESESKLYANLRRYNQDNNTNNVYDLKFTLLEECNEEQLTERENYWMEHFDALYKGQNTALSKERDMVAIRNADAIKLIKLATENTWKQVNISYTGWVTQSNLTQFKIRFGKSKLVNVKKGHYLLSKENPKEITPEIDNDGFVSNLEITPISDKTFESFEIEEI